VSDSLVLLCAVFASLASGVLLAYAVCQAVFALFRMHARRSPARSRARVTVSASIVEG
jgi:hypothetical protein